MPRLNHLLRGLLQPGVEVLRGHDDQGAAHLVMAQAAELRTGHFVGAGLGGGEAERDRQAGDDVLLQAEFADEEVVDDVAAFELDFDGAARGDAENRGA